MDAMETTYRPISKRRLAELRECVAPTTAVFRTMLFLGSLEVLAWVLAGAHRLLVPSQLSHPFPWTEFEILEAPRSKVFFGLVPIGDRLQPSNYRSPFTWEEYKALGMGERNYALLDLDFEALKKEGRVTTGSIVRRRE